MNGKLRNALLRERLPCIQGVTPGGVSVGHLPKRLSKICSLFLRRGGSIHCTVTGGRRFSADLPQGGLEIPCNLKFTAEAKLVKKLKQCMKAL